MRMTNASLKSMTPKAKNASAKWGIKPNIYVLRCFHYSVAGCHVASAGHQRLRCKWWPTFTRVRAAGARREKITWLQLSGGRGEWQGETVTLPLGFQGLSSERGRYWDTNYVSTLQCVIMWIQPFSFGLGEGACGSLAQVIVSRPVPVVCTFYLWSQLNVCDSDFIFVTTVMSVCLSSQFRGEIKSHLKLCDHKCMFVIQINNVCGHTCKVRLQESQLHICDRVQNMTFTLRITFLCLPSRSQLDVYLGYNLGSGSQLYIYHQDHKCIYLFIYFWSYNCMFAIMITIVCLWLRDACECLLEDMADRRPVSAILED